MGRHHHQTATPTKYTRHTRGTQCQKSLTQDKDTAWFANRVNRQNISVSTRKLFCPSRNHPGKTTAGRTEASLDKRTFASLQHWPRRELHPPPAREDWWDSSHGLLLSSAIISISFPIYFLRQTVWTQSHVVVKPAAELQEFKPRKGRSVRSTFRHFEMYPIQGSSAPGFV